MKIEAQVKINEEAYKEGSSTSELASAWVEIEECIKFPVKIRRYMDKKENKEKMFVSYPQRKTEQGYSNVVYPSDRAVREEIEACIWESMKHCVVRDFNELPVTDVRVTLLKGGKQDSKVAARGIATIKLGGITINGIMIKEGRNGLFVQMPQHRSGGEYRDTVYGTSSSMQYKIRTEVLYAYEKELKKAQAPEKEKQEPEEMTPELMKKKSIEKVMEAYEGGTWGELSLFSILYAAPLEIGPAELTEDQSLVKTQRAVMQYGEISVVARFVNEYEPLRTGKDTVTEQKIEVTVYKKGEEIGTKTVHKLRGAGEGADVSYQIVYEDWKRMTGNAEALKNIEYKEEETVGHLEMGLKEAQKKEKAEQGTEQSVRLQPEKQQNYGLPPMQPRRYAMDQNGEMRRTWNGKLPEQFDETDLKNFLAENEAVLKHLSAEKPSEEMTPEMRKKKSIEKFIDAYKDGNVNRMLSILSAAPLEPDVTELTEDQSMVRMQYAAMWHEEDSVTARFVNSYEPAKSGKDTPTEQKIEVTVYKNGEWLGNKVLSRLSGTSEKEAEENYRAMYDSWKKINGNEEGRKKIEHQEKSAARHTEALIQVPKL